MRKATPVVVAAVLIILILGFSFGGKILERYSYSEERRDLNEYFELTAPEDTALILNSDRKEEKGVLRDGRCYLDLDTVHTYLNERFYADFNEGLLLYTTPDEIISMQAGTEACFIEDGVMYVALDYVKKYTNFSFEVYTEPNRAVLTTNWEEYEAADISKDTQVRYQGGVKSDVLTDVKAGDRVRVLEELENWSKVATRDGFIGYVENKRLENQRTEAPIPVTDYTEPEYPSIHRDYKICLGWHQVTSQEANSTLDSVLEGTVGMNVISPTWFALSHNDGSFASIGSSDYVEKAHSRGLEVWILLDNFTYEVDTKEILSYTSKRASLIERLVEETMALGADGINVDLEQVPADAGEDYIEFLRELSISCRANGLVLSVDNYVPKNYNAHYNWKEQGIVADYVIIMGYDEHYSGSQEAVSVASINYVEEGISTMVQSVPAQKVVNGVPFYTRIWETGDGQVTSQAVGMAAAEKFLKDRGVEAVWDETTCQYYAEVQDGDSLYQVWLEDARSLEVKMSIMSKYDLGGVAVWKLGYESGRSEVWDVLTAFVYG